MNNKLPKVLRKASENPLKENVLGKRDPLVVDRFLASAA